ncbi:hypothetical protein THOD04_60122 [Vibrio owensii]|nr:hypothetical protein THOD04_60122 [Vibrio owensii]
MIGKVTSQVFEFFSDNELLSIKFTEWVVSITLDAFICAEMTIKLFFR